MSESTVVRELVAILGLDLDEAELKRAEGLMDKAKGFAVGLSAAFAGAGAVLGGMVKELADAGDEARDASIRLGTSVEAIQELRVAAELSGVGTDQLGVSLEQLQRRAAEAATGNKELGKVFSDLGIRVKGADGRLKPTDQLLGEIGDKLSKVQDAGRRTQIAFDLFGRSGGPMLQLLAEGSAGLAEMRKQAQETGAIISADLAAQGDELNDTLGLLQLDVRGLSRTLAADLLPDAIAIAQAMREWVAENRAWIRSGIHNGVGLLRAGVGGLFRELRRDYRVLRQFMESFGGLRTLAIVLGLALGGFLAFQVGKAAMAVDELVGKLKWLTLAQLKAVAIPVLIGAAVLAFIGLLALAIDEINTFEDGGDSLIGRLHNKLKEPFSANDSPLLVILKEIDRVATAAYKTIKALTESGSDLVNMLSGDETIGAKEERRARVAGYAKQTLNAVGLERTALTDWAFRPPADPLAYTARPSTGPLASLVGPLRTSTPTVAPTINLTVQTQPGADGQGIGDTIISTIQGAMIDMFAETARAIEAGSPVKR